MAYIKDNVLTMNSVGSLVVGLPLEAGPLEAEADSGPIVLFDMPVTATPAAGSEMSSSIRIDGDTIIKFYSEADSAGGTQNARVEIPLANLGSYANNAAAVVGGLVVGSLYRTGGDPDAICVVH